MQHGTETGWRLTWGQGILWHGGQQTGAALLQTGSNKPFISSWSDIVPGHQGRDSALSLTSKNVLFRQKDEGSAALKALWVKYAISVKGNKWLLASVGAVTMTTQRVCVLLVKSNGHKNIFGTMLSPTKQRYLSCQAGWPGWLVYYISLSRDNGGGLKRVNYVVSWHLTSRGSPPCQAKL